MKFKVHSKQLSNAMTAVSKVINAKNAMTILNNFLFDIDEHYATITAADPESTLTARVEIADLEGEPGKFCIDAKRFVDLFKELPELMVEITVDENLGITIDYPGGKFDFIGIDGNEYPTAINENTDNSEPVTFTTTAQQIIDGIDKALFAVSTDDHRPNLMGIYLDIKESEIIFVATDTRKLVKYRNWSMAPGVTCSFILPVKPANIIKNVFAKAGELKVTVDTKSATITSDQFVYNFRFIKGMFPDYNRVIPTNNPYLLTIDRHAMLNAIRRVSVFVEPGHGLVKFRITPELIELKAQDANFCTSGQERIACDFTGERLVIGFSGPYLAEIFNTIPTESVMIKLADPSRPGVYLPETDAENEELLMLLMPMTVGDF